MAAQAEQIAALTAHVAELEAKLRRNSRNSSIPPSSEGYSKPPTRRSLRRSSGRKPGGQPGSKGTYLEQVEHANTVIEHLPERCEACGESLDTTRRVGDERRQVFDLPPINLSVAEHRSVRMLCRCGSLTDGRFPQGVGAPTQYGPGVRAVGVYLVAQQHLPYKRATQVLGDCFGAPLSTGTLARIVAQTANGLKDFTQATARQLAGAEVAHFDETGARVKGALRWVHSASTNHLTLYTVSDRRGCEGINQAGVLPDFSGVAVHDGWTPYRSYESCDHALCGAHHLRELQAATETGCQPWAKDMGALLVEIAREVEDAVGHGSERLCEGRLASLEMRYRKIIACGHQQNPEPKPTGRRGRRKRSKAHNLLLRLDDQRAEVLRFAHDFRVPFTNNLAERDIRMVKLQQKISGSWRTTAGAERFLVLRSYISTARKEGRDILASLREAAADNPWLPPPLQAHG